MTNIGTYDVKSGASGEKAFDADLGERPLFRTMKDVVVQYQANRRQGDAHTKIRSELRGHKAKPWRQKKTGRARHGDRRSPLWRGGATVFGPRNQREWHYHMPRKQRLVALRSALLGKIQDEEVRELSGLNWDEPSARSARKLLNDCAPEGSVLVLLAEPSDTLWRSFRNFPQVSVRTALEVNAYDLLAHKWLLTQEGALDALAERLPAPSRRNSDETQAEAGS